MSSKIWMNNNSEINNSVNNSNKITTFLRIFRIFLFQKINIWFLLSDFFLLFLNFQCLLYFFKRSKQMFPHNKYKIKSCLRILTFIDNKIWSRVNGLITIQYFRFHIESYHLQAFQGSICSLYESNLKNP